MKNKHNRFIAGVLMAGMFFSSAVFVSAQTASSSPDVATLTAQVQSLLAQIQTLQAQITANQKELVSIKQELALTRSLAFGSKGTDVSDLQVFLKTMPNVYPEGLVTGFFGHATEKAIKKLQEKHGLEQAGIVGPKTREKLRQLFSEHRGNGVSRGHDGGNKKGDDDNDNEHGRAIASTTPGVGVGKVVICHKPGHGNHGETITIAAPALWAHMKHGDTMGACRGGTGTTTPDITAPVISNIISQLTTVAATISWDTNESASYKFWYATVTPVVLGTPNNTGVVGTHQTVSLSGLSSNTAYHYVIAATDASGNTSTSSEQSFTTLAIPDTTAPVISSVSASAITASSATLLWNTDENADSTVWYSTVNPLDVASTTATTKVTNATLGMSHSVPLSGLTASTTYYYIVGSKDAAGNQATSSQTSFLTL